MNTATYIRLIMIQKIVMYHGGELIWRGWNNMIWKLIPPVWSMIVEKVLRKLQSTDINLGSQNAHYTEYDEYAGDQIQLEDQVANTRA